MYQIMRVAMRPALVAGLANAQATTAAVVSAVPVSLWPTCRLARHRFYASSPSDEALRKAERMVKLMSESPQLQQMILNAMPAPMRNPDAMKQMFGDPAKRKRIAEMIASRGFAIPDHILDRMTPTSMGDTFSRAQRVGLDPSQMFTKLMAHPGLLAKLQQPRVMAAFLDIAEDPARQAKYEDDKELLEVVFKAREVLGATKPAAPPASGAAIPIPPSPAESSTGASVAATATVGGTDGASTSASGTPNLAQPPPPGQPPRAEATSGEAEGETRREEESTSGAAGPGAGAVPTNLLVSLMLSDPKAARWLDNPEVMAALEEVNKKPWKTVKYVFNKNVMAAFKDLSNLMRGKKA